jgi:hypothetical protein
MITKIFARYGIKSIRQDKTLRDDAGTAGTKRILNHEIS